jgi:hypothetical protein
MISDELLNITKVQETHSEKEANELLESGWRLLNIYTVTFSVELEDQMNIYVLGKSEERKHI